MKQFFLLFIHLFALSASAQKNDEVKVEPEPFQLTPYFGNHDSTGIKVVYTISKSDQNNFLNDTLNTYYYNKQGQQEKTVRYENNRPASNLDITYDKNGNEAKAILTELKNKERISTTAYEYNAQNKRIKIEGKSIRLGNVENIVTKNYHFFNNKLITKTIFQNTTLSETDSFFYNKDQLILHKQLYPSPNSYENVYTYDSSGQLTKRETKNLFGSKPDITLVGIANYTYEKGNLVTASESDWKNLQNKKPIITSYSYNQNSKLSVMRVEYDSLFREIKFDYDKDKIAAINVLTNTDNNAYMKFWASTHGYYIEKMPFTYNEQFSYDKKNNLISKKIFLNEKMIKETAYVIEYY